SAQRRTTTMTRSARDPDLPACYAMVHPGLEAVAADEIRTELGGEIKRSEHGFVVFRLKEIDRAILQLRTTEDVFLHAWGTDQLSYRAADLESIQRWTDKQPDWAKLIKIHHAITPNAERQPTYHTVAP